MSAMTNAIRAFIAIELPEDILAQLGQVQAQIKKLAPPDSVRWVRPQGIHLTLKFLGQVPLAQLDTLTSSLAGAVKDVPGFTLAVQEAGCFPSVQRPHVIWVGIQEASGTLERLQRAVESAIAPLGYPTESRPFHPHLTLGRVGRQLRPGNLRKLGESVLGLHVGSLGQLAVHEVALIRSELQPSGAHYTTLARAALLA